MGSGYHSRSPEEFRKYINDLNSAPKTKTWRNVIIFIDILLLILVFYMASKKINPSMDIAQKSSSKILLEDGTLQAYFSKSINPPPESIGYFLFIANKSQKEITYGKDLSLKFIVRSETGKECLQKDFQLVDKRISPGMSENYSFFFEKILEEALPDDCKSVYRKPPFPRTIDTFLKKKYRIDTILYLESKNGIKKELVLTDDNW